MAASRIVPLASWNYVYWTHGLIDYCPYRWTPWENACLDMRSEPMISPDNARQICQQKDASLVVVENDEQNGFLAEKIGVGDMQYITLGCKDAEPNGHWHCWGKEPSSWYWFNATSNLGYWNWTDNEPSNGDQPGCLLLSDTSEWLDDDCTNEHDLIVACIKGKISEPVRCPMSWEPVHNKCLYFIDHVVGSPGNGGELCSSLGGSLVIIDNEEQNMLLTEKLQSSLGYSILLGCSDRHEDGHWICDQGLGNRSPYLVYWKNDSEAGYWNWDEDEPVFNDDENNFVYLTSNGTWKSAAYEEVDKLLTCETTPTTIKCPPGNYKPWEDKCLYLGAFSGTHVQAKETCQQRGSELVVLESEGQNLFMELELRNRGLHSMYVGCSDSKSEGTWTCDGYDPGTWYWINETLYDGYWNWHPSHPNSNDCIYIPDDGFMRSGTCDSSHTVMLACTAEPVNVVPSTPTTEVTATIIPSTSMTTKLVPTTPPTETTATIKPSASLTTKYGGIQPPQAVLSTGAIVGIVGKKRTDEITFQFQKASSDAHLMESS
ncbi:C-type mannose receptor 2-like [Amphiura filiformis]|uniref:C-type mannose receptor 2-like n=1 Tax=Amphiura filiformis TaxID=82378 RepID=UPI003B223D44